MKLKWIEITSKAAVFGVLLDQPHQVPVKETSCHHPYLAFNVQPSLKIYPLKQVPSLCRINFS
jgi:hypothetical protein